MVRQQYVFINYDHRFRLEEVLTFISESKKNYSILLFYEIIAILVKSGFSLVQEMRKLYTSLFYSPVYN